MILERNIGIMLLAPLVGLVLPAAILMWKVSVSGLTTTEKELLSFSSQSISVMRPEAIPPYAGIENPIRIQKKAVPLSGTAHTAEKQPAKPVYMPRISMIYNDGGSRMAIIDGNVLREGSSVNGHTILKIEKTRVLSRTAGKEIWLSIE